MDEAAAREQVAKSTADKQASVEQAYANMGKPTPTQEENDLAALGVPFEQHEPDGSPEAAPAQQTGMTRRQSEPNKPASGGYQTRTMPPAAPARDAPKADTAKTTS